MTTAISRSIPPQRLINFVNPVVRAVLQSPLHGAVDNALLLLHIIAARPATTTTSPWDTAKRTLRLPQKSCCRGSRTGGQITKLKHGEHRGTDQFALPHPISVAACSGQAVAAPRQVGQPPCD
jgi:hypothetical protein